MKLFKYNSSPIHTSPQYPPLQSSLSCTFQTAIQPPVWFWPAHATEEPLPASLHSSWSHQKLGKTSKEQCEWRQAATWSPLEKCKYLPKGLVYLRLKDFQIPWNSWKVTCWPKELPLAAVTLWTAREKKSPSKNLKTTTGIYILFSEN